MTRRRFALLFVLALGMGTAHDATASQPVTAPPAPLPPGRVEIALEDLHCKSCAKKVARQLYTLKGVRKVQTYLKADLVVVLLPAKQTVEPATLWRAVVAGGVKPTEIRFAAQRLDVEQMAPLLQTASRPAVTR